MVQELGKSIAMGYQHCNKIPSIFLFTALAVNGPESMDLNALFFICFFVEKGLYLRNCIRYQESGIRTKKS
jgi:hypothetical protein